MVAIAGALSVTKIAAHQDPIFRYALSRRNEKTGFFEQFARESDRVFGRVSGQKNSDLEPIGSMVAVSSL
jgi:hypothetical protein